MMDDVFEGNDEAEEDIYNQIFDEVGIEFNEKVTNSDVSHAKATRVPKVSAKESEKDVDDEMERMLKLVAMKQ